MKLTVSIESAPAIIAEFVKQGIQFSATETDEGIEIVFTGGF